VARDLGEQRVERIGDPVRELVEARRELRVRGGAERLRGDLGDELVELHAPVIDESRPRVDRSRTPARVRRRQRRAVVEPRTMSRPWLDRFVDPITLAENRGFRIVGALDTSLGRHVTLVVPREGASRDAAALALDRLHRAHADPAHPDIARAVERATTADVDHVVLDVPARLDLGTLVDTAAQSGWRTSMVAAEGFSSGVREAVLASGARVDPATGEPLCLGTLAFGNVLFTADGRHTIVGFGHNVACLDEHGRFAPHGRFFHAPEIAAGATPTLMSDYLAIVRMSRTLIAFVTLPAELTRCLTGHALPEDAELVQLLTRFEASVLQTAPAARLPIAEMLAMAARIRVILGTEGDPAAFRADVARLIAHARPDLVGAHRALRVARDLGWVEVGGAAVRLTPLQRRLFAALVSARLERPGELVAADVLVAAGWPREHMSHDSSRNRLHVALSSLRKLGLADELERDEQGYRLSPSLRLELADR